MQEVFIMQQRCIVLSGIAHSQPHYGTEKVVFLKNKNLPSYISVTRIEETRVKLNLSSLVHTPEPIH